MTNINTFQGDVFIHEYIKHTGDDNSLFGFSGGDTFKIATGGTDRLTVKADGTVGIGTNAPISVFHTFGGELWDGSDHASKVCATLAVARGGGAGGAASTLDAGTGAILKLTHDGTGYRHATMESVSEAPYSGQVGIRFKTLETGNTTAPLERMRITGSGKVGIGTDAPESLLHLSASTASADITDPIKLKIHNRRGAGDWSITQPWGLLEFDTDDTGTAGSGPVAGIGCRFEQAGGGDASICFYTDNVVNDDNVLGAANERMCINSDGKVGVGTASPLADLDVNGNIKSRGNLYLAPATIESDTKVGNSDAFLLMHHSTFHGDLGPNHPLPECGTIMTNRSGGGTFPWLMYTGLVKDVAASTPVTSLRMDWGQGSSTGSATDLEDATLNPLMTLRFSGQLGLGTTAPATKLHLEHSGSAIGDFEGIRIANHATNLHSTSRPAYEFVVSDIAAGTGIGASKFAIGYRGTTSASRTDRLVIDASGNVGIGTTNPIPKFAVYGSGTSNFSATSYYLKGSITPIAAAASGWGVSIYGNGDVVAGQAMASNQGALTASDTRIKKNIVDADDSECLEVLRLLRPKKYQYKDEIKRGQEPVWGFIAQEVRETLPYASQLRQEFLPNIYELANVSSSNVITFTDFNTTNLESNATTLIRTVGIDGEDRDIHLAEVIDEHTIRVEEDLTEWIGSVDETGNVVAGGNQLFICGQQVDDFVFLKKDAIWTVATAALQEVDRQLQAEKAKNESLETQVSDLLARVTALENA